MSCATDGFSAMTSDLLMTFVFDSLVAWHEPCKRPGSGHSLQSRLSRAHTHAHTHAHMRAPMNSMYPMKPSTQATNGNSRPPKAAAAESRGRRIQVRRSGVHGK